MKSRTRLQIQTPNRKATTITNRRAPQIGLPRKYTRKRMRMSHVLVPALPSPLTRSHYHHAHLDIDSNILGESPNGGTTKNDIHLELPQSRVDYSRSLSESLSPLTEVSSSSSEWAPSPPASPSSPFLSPSSSPPFLSPSSSTSSSSFSSPSSPNSINGSLPTTNLSRFDYQWLKNCHSPGSTREAEDPGIAQSLADSLNQAWANNGTEVVPSKAGRGVKGPSKLLKGRPRSGERYPQNPKPHHQRHVTQTPNPQTTVRVQPHFQTSSNASSSSGTDTSTSSDVSDSGDLQPQTARLLADSLNRAWANNGTGVIVVSRGGDFREGNKARGPIPSSDSNSRMTIDTSVVSRAPPPKTASTKRSGPYSGPHHHRRSTSWSCSTSPSGDSDWEVESAGTAKSLVDSLNQAWVNNGTGVQVMARGGCQGGKRARGVF